MAVKELTKTQRAIALITVTALFIYAIVNAFLVIYAYTKLSKNVDQLVDFVDNWKAGAIIEVQVAASCGAGYEPIFSGRDWYGVSAGCYCDSVSVTPAERSQYNITCSPFCSYTCPSTFQTAGCQPVTGQSAQTLSYWGKVGGVASKICVKRSKETWVSQAPLVGDDGKCPSGYTTCGTSTDYKFCTKEAKCPITKITWGTTTAGCSSPTCFVVDNEGGFEKTLTILRGNDVGGDGIPLAEFRLNEYGMCDLKDEDDITPSRPNFGLLKNKISTCNNEGGSLWLSGTSLSTVKEDRLFSMHGLTAYITNLNNYPNPSTGMTGYYASGKTGANYDWNLYGRNYIPFKQSCRDDMKSVLSKSEKLTNLKTAQTALLVIGLISTAVLGIVLSYMEIQNLRGVDLPCIDGKGEAERTRLKKIKKILTYVFKFLVIPFQIWAIALTGTTKSLFAKVGENDCSNAVANGLFTYFGDTLKSSYKSNITAIALTVATLIFDMILAWWDARKAKKEALKVSQASGNNPHNNSEKETLNIDHSLAMSSPTKTPVNPYNQQSQFNTPAQPNSGGGLVIQINQGSQPQPQPQPQAFAQQQFAQPQPQPQFVQPQPQFVQPQPQFVQPQPQAYAQPQFAQPQYGQPQFAQPQYGQPQFQQPVVQNTGIQERSNPFGNK